MARSFVSVLIDTYNHEKFIEQAIISVLEQDFPEQEREVIVVDDGSTDRTPEIVRKFEPRVRLLRKANGGQASAFNAGIPECKGEIVAFLDGDDWWASKKLSGVIEIFEKEAQVGLVGHGIIESFTDHIERTHAPEKDERLTLSSLAAARVFRLRKSYLGTSRMALRASLVRRILPVPESLVIEADEYLFTMAGLFSEILILQRALTYYRIHGANLYVGAGGEGGMRRKQQVMAGLADILGKHLLSSGASREVTDCLVEIVQAEADQILLMLDGGTPWKTFQTERKLYAVMHGDASYRNRIFRSLTMVPALLLPPRRFYASRSWLNSRQWYMRMREKVLPIPKITKVAGPDEFKA